MNRAVSLALAVFASAGLAALLAGAGNAGHKDRNGRIAFVHITFADGPPTQSIVTIEPDGSDPREVTDTAPVGASEHPSWTPTGNRILFDSDRADGFPHLFAINPNGRHLEQLTSGTNFQGAPSMSPDGRLIAFNGQTFDPADSGIYLVDRRGGTIDSFRRVIVFPGPDTNFGDDQPDFSPDGTKIAFVRETVTRDTAPEAQAAIFVVRTDGSHLTQLTPYSLDAEAPHWSPDGKRIAFDVNADNHDEQISNNVYVMNTDGTGLTQLTHDSNGSNSFHPDCSPDGRKLVFAHRTGGENHTELDVMNADGSHVTTIWHGADGTSARRPSWSTSP